MCGLHAPETSRGVVALVLFSVNSKSVIMNVMVGVFDQCRRENCVFLLFIRLGRFFPFYPVCTPAYIAFEAYTTIAWVHKIIYELGPGEAKAWIDI